MVSEHSNERGSFAKPALENVVLHLARFSWLIAIVSALVYAIMGGIAIWGAWVFWTTWGFGAFNPSAVLVGQIVWAFICLGAQLVFTIIYVVPKFVKKVANRDWEFLVNDVIVLGTFRLPKMLLFGALAAVFGYGWGSVGILVPALIILLAGPVPVQWKSGEPPVKKAASPVPEPVVKKQGKVAPESLEQPAEEPVEEVTEKPVEEVTENKTPAIEAGVNGLFTCDYCSKEYKTERGLQNHLVKCPEKP